MLIGKRQAIVVVANKIQQIFDFLSFLIHNNPANPKDCYYQKPCVRYAQGTSTGEFSLLMTVFFVG